MCGRTVCADCDQGDRHVSLCSEHGHIPIVQGWVEVWQAGTDSEAELVAGHLRARDLDAQVLSQKDHAHMLSVAGMAIVRVLVPAAQYLVSAEYIDALRRQDDAS